MVVNRRKNINKESRCRCSDQEMESRLEEAVKVSMIDGPGRKLRGSYGSRM